MAHAERVPNRVKQFRTVRGWSQEELARRAGISRAEVSAIEIQRVVPSVAAALALSAALLCQVEDLFGASAEGKSPEWAWEPAQGASRFWQAEVAGKILRFPVESTAAGTIPHDGVLEPGADESPVVSSSERTIMMASCDPAAGLLASEIARTSDFRLIVLPRSSSSALELLQKRLIHVAGIHLSGGTRSSNNAAVVRERLGAGYRLLHGARWTEGLAFEPGLGGTNIRSLLRSKLRWIGREVGSGARQCLDEVLEGRPAPKRLARDHRGVADAIRCGWADVGVCLQLTSDEAGLKFLRVREEAYDLCYATEFDADPRLRTLVRVIRSPEYRRLVGELPGYSAENTGETISVE